MTAGLGKDENAGNNWRPVPNRGTINTRLIQSRRQLFTEPLCTTIAFVGIERESAENDGFRFF
jgi:hypothetical protein